MNTDKNYMYFYTKVSKENISTNAKTVYRALLRYANKDTWTCFPSIKTLANDTGLSVRTIIRKLHELEKEELILKINRTRKNRGDTSNIYFFL